MSDLLDQPLSVLHNLYTTNTTEEDFPAFARKHLNPKIISSFKDIPLLNSIAQADLDKYKHKLCRFRCMIQDTTWASEVYASTSTLPSGEKRSNAFHDGLEDDSVPDMQGLQERSVLFAVEPPAETAWAREIYAGDTSLANLSMSEEKPAWSNKFPLPEKAGIAALVKVYDQEESLRATDVVEVIGVLDFTEFADPSLDLEKTDALPLIPSIHVLHYSKPELQLGEAPSTEHWPALRSSLIEYLASHLAGDKSAAEFLLLSMLSRIHLRKAGALLGYLPINLCFTSDSTQDLSTLSRALSNLLPSFHELEMTLPTLNDKKPYAPTSKSESLHAGILQLPSSTFLLLNETSMKEGQLTENGVKKLQIVNKVLGEQKLAYSFPFSEFEFETDFGVVVGSRGKSLLPVKCVVPVVESKVDAVKPGQDVEKWRAMLGKMRACDATVAEDVSAHIEEDFIELRKKGGNAIGHEDLMLRMTIARLLALSYGKTGLDLETYRLAAELDDERRARLATTTLGSKD